MQNQRKKVITNFGMFCFSFSQIVRILSRESGNTIFSLFRSDNILFSHNFLPVLSINLNQPVLKYYFILLMTKYNNRFVLRRSSAFCLTTCYHIIFYKSLTFGLCECPQTDRQTDTQTQCNCFNY